MALTPFGESFIFLLYQRLSDDSRQKTDKFWTEIDFAHISFSKRKQYQTVSE